MQRRTFLSGLSAAAVGACVPRFDSSSECTAADVPDAFKNLDVIDCHTHFYDPSRPEGAAWPQKGSPLYRTVLPKDLRALKQYVPVTGTVIVEASPRLEDNAWLLEIAKTDPFVVGIVGHIDPSPEFAAHVKRFAANPLFRGIRVGSNVVKAALEKNDFADFKTLAAHDLALDVNGGPDTPALVAVLGEELPELRIIQNHIGNVKITKAAPPSDWVAGIQAAGKQKNVWCKISALVEGANRDKPNPLPADVDFYRPYIDVVWNAFGDDRVIYGSNWPVSDGAADYYTLEKIALDYAAGRGADALKKFCSLNAKQGYKWVDREGRRGA